MLLLGAVGALQLALTFASFLDYVVAPILLVAAAGLGVVLLYWEKCKAKDPILPLKLLKNPVLSYVVANTLQFVCQAGMGYMFPYFFRYTKRSGKQMGIFSFVVSIGATVDAFLIPLLQKFVVNKTVTQVCSGVCCVLLLAIVLTAGDEVAYIALYCTCLIVSTVIPFVVLPSIILAVPKSSSGQIAAIPTTSKTVGQGLSSSISALVLQIGMKEFGKTKGELEAFFTCSKITHIIFLVLLVMSMIWIQFGTGHNKSDAGKKGYKEEKVRELTINEV